MSKKLAKIFKEREQNGWPIRVPNDGQFKIGDVLTIDGHKYQPDGTTIRNCKPGEESKMIVAGYLE